MAKKMKNTKGRVDVRTSKEQPAVAVQGGMVKKSRKYVAAAKENRKAKPPEDWEEEEFLNDEDWEDEDEDSGQDSSILGRHGAFRKSWR